jgi:alpha-tubulin suppressor-like RCC1 family protein
MTCALFSDHQVRCWGDNTYGELGSGTTSTSSYGSANKARLVPGLTNATQISIGWKHGCALVSDGTVFCWGSNASAQIGNGSPGSTIAAPSQVTGLTGVTAISAGTEHTCARKSDGTIWCWGSGPDGELGDGVCHDYTAGCASAVPGPTQAVGVANATEIYAAISHTCALISDGTLMCWGDNTYGQLGGVSLLGTRTSTPIAVPNLKEVAHLAMGDSNQTCVILTDGTVKCWGRNLNCSLGTSPNLDMSNTPTLVPGLSGIRTIALDYDHACVVGSNGALLCWGDNATGQLGNGTTTSGCAQAAPCGVDRVSAVGIGGNSACAILTNGVLVCWGYNSNGQVGDGTTTKHYTPIVVPGSL